MRLPITDSRSATVAAIVVSAALAPAIFGVAGCSKTNHTGNPASTTTGSSTAASSANPTTSTPESSTAQIQIGNTLNYGSFGTTAELDCADGKGLNVGGSNNTLTVKGTCSSVSIGGADNKITFDKIDKQLTVVGLNNSITYKDGDPKVENLGQSNTINKG
jgi:hypothetical protein